MLSMLVAYDADGNIVATLDYMVARNEAGNAVGLLDFDAYEAAGGRLRDIWNVQGAAGSGTWPEWIGSKAHEFRVELEPRWKRSTSRAKRSDNRIRALVHKQSGLRRERTTTEAAIAQRIAKAAGGSADIRDLVGGPERPLVLDNEGRTISRAKASGTPKHLPVLDSVARGHRPG